MSWCSPHYLERSLQHSYYDRDPCPLQWRWCFSLEDPICRILHGQYQRLGLSLEPSLCCRQLESQVQSLCAFRINRSEAWCSPNLDSVFESPHFEKLQEPGISNRGFFQFLPVQVSLRVVMAVLDLEKDSAVEGESLVEVEEQVEAGEEK